MGQSFCSWVVWARRGHPTALSWTRWPCHCGCGTDSNCEASHHTHFEEANRQTIVSFVSCVSLEQLEDCLVAVKVVVNDAFGTGNSLLQPNTNILDEACAMCKRQGSQWELWGHPCVSSIYVRSAEDSSQREAGLSSCRSLSAIIKLR